MKGEAKALKELKKYDDTKPKSKKITDKLIAKPARGRKPKQPRLLPGQVLIPPFSKS